MDMSGYMTFEVKLKRAIGEDEDTRMMEYGEEEEIKCFIYGKNLYVREGMDSTVVSAKVYLTLDDVKVMDIIDGQVVKSVNSYPESWDSSVQLYEVLTWDS